MYGEGGDGQPIVYNLQVPSADNLYKQFGHTCVSSQTKYQAWSGSKKFDTDGLFERFFFFFFFTEVIN